MSQEFGKIKIDQVFDSSDDESSSISNSDSDQSPKRNEKNNPRMIEKISLQEAKTMNKIADEVEGRNNYEFPEDDDKLVLKSNLLQNVLVCFNLSD